MTIDSHELLLEHATIQFFNRSNRLTIARVKYKRILAMGRDELVSAIDSANIGKRDRYIAKAYWLDREDSASSIFMKVMGGFYTSIDIEYTSLGFSPNIVVQSINPSSVTFKVIGGAIQNRLNNSYHLSKPKNRNLFVTRLFETPK